MMGMSDRHTIPYYPPNPGVELLLELCAFMANHNGELDAFHALPSMETGHDGLDEAVDSALLFFADTEGVG